MLRFAYQVLFMKFNPVTEYIANHLTTWVFLWSEGKAAYSCSYQSDILEIPEIVLQNGDLLKYLLEQAGTDSPVISFINNQFSFIHFHSPEGIFVIGPFRMAFTEYSTAAVHNFSVPELENRYIPDSAPVMPFDAVRCALLLFNLVNEAAVDEGTCMAETFSTRVISSQISRRTVSDLFSSRENLKKHNSYELEVLQLKCIEDGDLDGLRRVWKFPTIGNLGVTAKDPVRNGKNLASFNVILAGRAAIRGGVPAETIFTIIDASVMQIEELQDMMVLQTLVQDIQLNFAQMVCDLKKQNEGLSEESYLVSESKSYISMHLHERLTVSEVADAIGAHPNYLSSLFKKSEGIAMHEYIIRQKITLAENLLVFSNYTYLEISQYLGFSSQSHLGQAFKKLTGMTMKEYKDRYRPENE